MGVERKIIAIFQLSHGDHLTTGLAKVAVTKFYLVHLDMDGNDPCNIYSIYGHVSDASNIVKILS